MAGPFFFAWSDATETIFGIEHHVIEEDIVNFKIDHTEGNCATLSIDVRNPKQGLLSAGRKQWAWLSYDQGTAGVTPLFFGRLTAIPTNILQEVVTLSFIAKPLDFQAQKEALAETLKVRPYDPVWIDPDKRSDVDTVLEHLAALWSVDRTSLQVGISDIISGEDGTEVFSADEIPYDSISISVGQTPRTSVNVIGKVNWTQSATGTINFGERWFDCWNGGTLVSSWPKTGAQLSGGWSVANGFAIDVDNIEGRQIQTVNWSYENTSKHHTTGDTMSEQLAFTVFPCEGEMFYSDVVTQFGYVPPGDGGTYTTSFTRAAEMDLKDTISATSTHGELGGGSSPVVVPLHVSYNQILVAKWKVHTGLTLQYEAGNKRNETVSFTLSADLQPIVTLPDPEEITDTISLNGTDVGISIEGATGDPFGGIPIVDTGRNGYFPTDRGLWSLEYLIAVARAHLLQRSRAVGISWDCSFDRAIELSCRKNATISDPRLPGGTATGKIVAYSISADGDAASMFGNVSIQCAIGNGGAVSAVAGTPDYVDNVFDDGEVQTWSNRTISLTDVGYSVPVLEPGGLVYPLTKDQVLVDEHVSQTTMADVQVGTRPLQYWNSAWPASIKPPDEPIMKQYPITEYYLELKPVTGQTFAAEYDVAVSQLKIPKMIDLAAAAL